MTLIDDADPTLTRTPRPVEEEAFPEDRTPPDDLDRHHTTKNQPSPSRHTPRSLRALRLGQLRIQSVAKVSAIFSVLGFLVGTGTIVITWMFFRVTGLVAQGEELIESALGVSDFRIGSVELLGAVAIGMALSFAVLFVASLALTFVYNATCAVFGGVTIEAQPDRRPPRLFERPGHRH